MMKNTGTSFELLTRSIFNLIVNEKRVETIDVRHDVELHGITAKHQIDVYWEFKVGGITHKTIVQTKDWSNPVKQEQLFAFKCILDDLQGQPRGVFVTRTGYQRGAREFAEKHGIVLYELREPTAEDKAEWIQTFDIDVIINISSFKVVELKEDLDWNLSQLEQKHIPLSESPKIELYDSTKIYNENGKEIDTLQYFFQSFVSEESNKNEAITINHEFDKPTFLEPKDKRVPLMKINAITFMISMKQIKKHYQIKGKDFVGYLLRNVVEGTERTIPKEIIK